MRWKSKYSDVPYEKLPSSPSSAIKDCDAEIYPKIRILLQLACTIPVTSCDVSGVPVLSDVSIIT